MKVVQQVAEKPKYVPITITLETAEEYFSVLAGLSLSSDEKEYDRLTAIGIAYINQEYVSYAGELHAELCAVFDKVKETL